MKALEVKNMSKSFGSLRVLNDVSFSLEKGEVLSVIGSSGGGKTTLLRCLNFLEKANNGEIYVNDELVYRVDEANKDNNFKKIDAQLNFGLVFQQFNLFPQYTVMDNLTLAPKLRKEQSKEEIDAQAMALLERVGLSEKAKSYPCEISGGQQQRVAIARALMLDPEILCFDEPTSALDPELTGEVLKVIKSLKTGDHTMVIVTHEMDFARNVSDKVMFISDGVIEEFGTPDKVFDKSENPKTLAFISGANNA